MSLSYPTESRQLALKEKLPEELVALMKGLWERVFTEAQAGFEKEKRHIQDSLDELQQQFSQLQTSHNLSQQKAHGLEQENLALGNDKASLEQTVIHLQKETASHSIEKDGLARQLQSQEIRVKELHGMHLQVQKNLEHYREASLEQRRQDQQSHDQQRHQLEQTTHQLRHEISQLQHQNAIIHQQFINEQNEKNRVYEQLLQMKNEMGSLHEKLNEFENKVFQQSQLNEHLQEKYKNLQVLQERDSQSSHNAKSQLVMVTQKLLVTEDALKKITDQHQSIVKEKWMLEQERIHFYSKNEKIAG